MTLLPVPVSPAKPAERTRLKGLGSRHPDLHSFPRGGGQLDSLPIHLIGTLTNLPRLAQTTNERYEDTMSNAKTGPQEPSNLEKDPEDWTTGDETMTGAQASYLKTLCEEAGGHSIQT
jgi:hypothetical protein